MSAVMSTPLRLQGTQSRIRAAALALVALGIGLAACQPHIKEPVHAICVGPEAQENPELTGKVNVLFTEALKKGAWSSADDSRLKRLLYTLPLETRLQHARTLATLVNTHKLKRTPRAEDTGEPAACSCECSARKPGAAR